MFVKKSVFSAIFSFSFLLMTEIGLGQGAWQTKTPLPTPLAHPMTTVVGGELHVIGGANGDELSSHFVYTPLTDGWSTKASLPAPRYGGGAVWMGTELIILAGANNQNYYVNPIVYDTLLDAWSELSSTMIAQGRFFPGITGYGGEIYLAGGGDNTGTKLSSMEVYIPEADSFKLLAPMSVARNGLGLAEVGGKLYAIGGSNQTGQSLDLVEEYDPILNLWQTKSPMPTARNEFGIAVSGGRIYVFGGQLSDPTRDTSAVEAYDPETDQWYSLSSDTLDRLGCGAAEINGRIYVVAGSAYPPAWSTLNREFTPPLFANPTIISVSDVPSDQGGKVQVRWLASKLDTNSNSMGYYSVWRALPTGTVRHNTMNRAHIESQYRIHPIHGVNYFWEWMANLPAHRFTQYSYSAPTLFDSTESNDGLHYFFVSAHTNDPNIFYDSNVDSGFSLDNLAPGIVASVSAQVHTGPKVNVHWTENTIDPDVKGYEIHRSTMSNFTASATTKIGETSDTLFVDTDPETGAINYYRIVTVDVHGNKSFVSAPTGAAVSITASYSVSAKWNMVSVPLTVENYSKTVLFQTATSSAFAFEGEYVNKPILANGTGYWIKFDGTEIIPITGLLRIEDTISVNEGWNMIGSISTPVSVTTIGSVPPGLITSEIYGYTNGYGLSSTIEPGKGYWIKVSQPGVLILSANQSRNSSTRIKIVPTDELPPAPPPGEPIAEHPKSTLPMVFALQQNFPNPFNPTTTIHFDLPAASRVTLSVFSTLGEEVALLESGEEQAGSYQRVWDATESPSGIYFYRLEAIEIANPAKAYREVRKMILVK